MLNLGDMKIGKKIGGGFTIVCALLITLSVITYYNYNNISNSAELGAISSHIAQNMLDMRLNEKNYLMRKDQKFAQELLKEALDTKKTIEDTLAKFALDDTNKKLFGDISMEIGKYEKVFGKMDELTKQKTSLTDKMENEARDVVQLANDMRAILKKQLLEIFQSRNFDQVEDRLTKADDANRIIKMALEARKEEKNFLISGGDKKYAEKLHQIMSDMANLTTNLRDRLAAADLKKLAESVLTNVKEYDESFKAVETTDAELDKVTESMVEAARKVVKLCEENSADLKQDMEHTMNMAINIMLAIAAASLILSVIIAMYIVKGVTTPINQMNAAAKEIADGNFAIDVSYKSKDEMGELATSFRLLIDKMNESFSEVNRAVTNVASAANQISQASQSLSSGATESAASLEEITASVTQIGSQTKSNAENSIQSSQLTNTVRAAAEKGNTEMSDMLKAIQQVCEDGQKIAKVVKMIDDIAFQTNVLSLNAAVEAARAGKHGRGFTVVADAVRSLANESATAAKETAALVEGTIKRMDGSLEIASKTSQSLNEIVTNSVKASDLVSEIAAASNEQAQGVSQIGQGLSQLNQVTQQSSANSEETAATAEELSGQAEELRRLWSAGSGCGATETVIERRMVNSPTAGR